MLPDGLRSPRLMSLVCLAWVILLKFWAMSIALLACRVEK
jgi:hypothetical protein